MKYLSHYTQQAQTNLFKSTGAFFAFNQRQFEEGKLKNPADKYIRCGGGMFVNKANYEALVEGLKTIQSKGMKQDVKENGRKGVIHRELGNYEVQISGDLTDAIEALEPYGITEEEVHREYKSFFQKCIDNDWF